MRSDEHLQAFIGLFYGVLCHAAFAAGVLMMMVGMYYGMQTTFGFFHSPWSWIANIVLLLQFPILHSYLLSNRGRFLLQRLAPLHLANDLTTTTYVIIVSLQTFILFTLWSPSGIVWWQSQGYLRLIITLSYLSAWLLLLKSMSDAGLALQTGLLGWRAVCKGIKPNYPPMPQHGMFRLCRQPIYFSFTLTLWTVPVWTPDQLLLAIVLTSYCLIGPLFKERRFIERYGDEFKVYQRNVSYWLPQLIARRNIEGNSKNKVILNNQSLYEEDASQWWNESLSWLRIMHNLVPARMNVFDKLVEDWRGLVVLDIGCGGGFMSEALAKKGALVTGIDPAISAIHAARKHARSEGLVINYQTGTGEALPVASVSFDCVVIVDVLEHVNNVESVLNEINRVLKPGGIILFDTINRTWLASFLFIWIGEKLLRLVPHGTHDPKLFIKPKELIKMLHQQGFEPGTFQGLGPVGMNKRFDFIFGKLPTTTVQYIGHAIKH